MTSLYAPRRKARKRRPSLGEALHLRAIGALAPEPFRLCVYSSIVPTHAFFGVSNVPNVVFRRFTPCGRFLVSIDRNLSDVVVFRFEGGSPRPSNGFSSETASYDTHPLSQSSGRANTTRHGLTDDGGSRHGARQGVPEEFFQAHAAPPGRQLFNVPGSQLDSHWRAGQGDQLGPAHGDGATQAVSLAGTGSSGVHGGAGLGDPVPTGGGLLAFLMFPGVPYVDAQASERPTNLRYQDYTCAFWRYFSTLYRTNVRANTGVLVKDFCLATQEHLIFASVVAPSGDTPDEADPAPAVSDAPCSSRIVFHLIHTETGAYRDSFALENEFVDLDCHRGVHMRHNKLCILSIRNQNLHILYINDAAGRMTPIEVIGKHCNMDDGFEIDRVAEIENKYRSQHKPSRSSSAPQTSTSPDHGNHSDEERPPEAGTGLGSGKTRVGVYSGLMHRLLVYVHAQYRRERNDRRFFRVVGQYSMLVMLRAQLLDDDHLFIRLGSWERELRTADGTRTCFFVVYCISTTKIVSLYDNKSPELLKFYETHRDLFVGDRMLADMLPSFRSNSSAPVAAVERVGQGRVTGRGTRDRMVWEEVRSGSGRRPGGVSDTTTASALSYRRAKLILSHLPHTSQYRNPSVYLNRKLFSFAEDRTPALDGSRPLSMRDSPSVKFVAARGGGLRFKLTPGIPGINRRGNQGGDESEVPPRTRALFLFHPYEPFVISMSASASSAMTFNFHVHYSS